jgi:hypothetical protein
MPLYKFQVSVAADSTAPRDRIVNTFHLNREAILNPGPLGGDALATDCCNMFRDAWYGPTREITTKIYNVGSPPNYPVGQKTINMGLAPASAGPREVSLCLSYYGARNLPRTRGRLYLPIYASIHGTAFGVRPVGSVRTSALGVATGIAALGGIDMDWQVYSPTTGDHENVQVAYVDDEWDTQRRRGLRPTTRSSMPISE